MSDRIKVLSKRQLRELVLYSPAHIQRLEKAGRFPKRVKLGPYRSSRVGWVESEVLTWLSKWLEERNTIAP
ncbi:MAG: AlpA family phage regulatory protein [Rhodomicrobium sp.]